MMKRLVCGLASALVLALVPLSPAGADEPSWVFEGSGWGHGVGMSQYGAYGMALEGASAAEILEHYYSGAFLDDLANRSLPSWWSEPYQVKVGLTQGVETLDVTAWHGPITVCHAGCTDGEEIPAYETWTISSDSGACRIEDAGGDVVSVGTCEIDFSWADDGTRVEVAGGEYAHGGIRLVPDDSDRFDVVLELPLELYIRGIAEVPGSWPSAVLEAQAIAARNYVIRKVLDRGEAGMSRCGGCHVYDTVIDQVYAGWVKEGVSPNRWVEAVSATTGVVAVHPSTGLVFGTYYSSSTGGATENNEDVWGGEARAYLRSVDDHWAVSPAVNNLNTTWSRTFSQSDLESLLGWETVLDAQLVDGPPGSTIQIFGVDGGKEVTRTFRGESLRLTFDLKSPWVSAVVSPYGFADVRLSVHQDDITYISDLGITKGCNPPDNNRFCPDALVTRGQMAAFLVRAADLPAADTDYFADDDDSIFEADINRLAAAGITSGCGEGRFCPDDPINRGQMAAFLVRAFGYTQPGEVDFADDDGSMFEAEIGRLARAGVTKGCNPPRNDEFCPDDDVTRAQMASFLARAIRTSS
jgi:peptidoglycan hydrolase-like amidase